MSKEIKLKRYNLYTFKGLIMNWKTYIEDCNKVGLESPTPYKVVPYKNGIGIKKIIFLDSGKKCCLPFDHTNDQKDSHHPSLIKGGI